MKEWMNERKDEENENTQFVGGGKHEGEDFLQKFTNNV